MEGLRGRATATLVTVVGVVRWCGTSIRTPSSCMNGGGVVVYREFGAAPVESHASGKMVKP